MLDYPSVKHDLLNLHRGPHLLGVPTVPPRESLRWCSGRRRILNRWVGDGKILVGCRRLNLLYARCGKNLWHFLPTFHWYILKPNVWERFHHLILRSQRKSIQKIPRFNIIIEILKPPWRFQQFFFLRGGRNSGFLFCEFKIQQIDL